MAMPSFILEQDKLHSIYLARHDLEAADETLQLLTTKQMGMAC